MDVNTFAAKYAGQKVKSPHGIAGQCVSVSSEFAVLNGWPELFGSGDDTALHIYNNGVAGYQKIANAVGNFPAPGDLFFFGALYGGGAGHTGVVVSANANTVILAEQNDPYGSGVHEKAYSYNGAMGWFHHPSAAPAPVPTPPAGAGGVYPVKSVVNVRTAPHVTAPVVTQLHVGTVQVTGVVTGDSGVVNGHTSNQWGITLNGHYFCMAATQ